MMLKRLKTIEKKRKNTSKGQHRVAINKHHPSIGIQCFYTDRFGCIPANTPSSDDIHPRRHQFTQITTRSAISRWQENTGKKTK